MTKVLIPNCSSPKNLGDQAILTALVQILKQQFHDPEVTIHAYDPKLHVHTAPGAVVRHSLCSWTAFANRNPVVRTVRVLCLLVLLFSKGRLWFLLPKELPAIASDYADADVIVFTGGGFLRTNPGLTQTLNLLLQLSMFFWANSIAQDKKRIAAPMSFGPFAFSWQEKLSARILSRVPIVMLRERISEKMLAAHGLANTTQAADLALLLSPQEKPVTSKDNVIGFTVRRWGSVGEFSAFKHALIEGIVRLAKEATATVLPVVQVDAPEYGEGDVGVVSELAEMIALAGVPVLPLKKIVSVNDALATYGNLSLMISMRMHANILAAVNSAPFMAISYEHKTEGIMEKLGLSAYVRPMQKVTAEWVFETGSHMLKNKSDIQDYVGQKLNEVRTESIRQWQKIVS